MLGTIYGDKAGSIYEFNETKKIEGINPDKLITEDSFLSDDTIEMIAVADAIINNKDYEETLLGYIDEYKDYKPNYKPYFTHPFSPNTMKILKGKGKKNSNGNGAMMRIAPVGYLFDKEEDVIENARKITEIDHNCKESVDSATIIALMIFYFRKGLTKEEVYKKLSLKHDYKPFKKFNMTCSETLENCLYAIYNSESFEDSIRKSLLMGGDTDTNCAITGSVAESLYGMTESEKSDAIANLPKGFVKVLKKSYDEISR